MNSGQRLELWRQWWKLRRQLDKTEAKLKVAYGQPPGG